MTKDEISPEHYQFPNAQVINLTEELPFNRGNVVKYVCRAGRKTDTDSITDLRKAQWYLEREIVRLTNRKANRKGMALMPEEDRIG